MDESQQTTFRIAESAADLFRTLGYVATTMQTIARHAEVAVQTIYNTVGGKADVLNLVLDRTVAGDEFPKSVPEFMQRRAAAAPDSATLITILADWFADVHPRSADVFGLIRDAAAVDPEVAALQRRREQRRLDNYRLAAAALEARGARALDLDEAAATIWAIGHPTVYRQLVVDNDWTVERYRSWVADTLGTALL